MGKSEPQKPFFYSEELTAWNNLSIKIYAGLTLTIFLICIWGTGQVKPNVLLVYLSLSDLSIYVLLCSALRNFKYYLVCFLFSLLHIAMYFFLRADDEFIMHNGNAINGLLNTAVLLLLFQLLRFLSLKLQYREFIVPAKFSDNGLWENKKVTGVDYLILFTYVICLAGLFMLATLN